MTLTSDYTTPSITTKHGRKRTLASIRYQSWINPATAALDSYKLAVAGPNTTTKSYGSLAGDTAFDGAFGAAGVADFPKNVVITVTDGAAVVAQSGVITGYDINGVPMTEAWSVTAGTTSKTFTGKKAFKKVTEVTDIAASDASGNTVKIGDGTVFGLDTVCSIASGVKETADGSVATNGTVVASNTSSTTDRFGTYSPNAAPNGAKTYELWYMSNDPTTSD